MNIGYLFNGRFPSERAQSIQIEKMCEAFVSLGHRVTLIVSNRKTSSESSLKVSERTFPLIRVPVIDMVSIASHTQGTLGALLYSIQRLFYVMNLRNLSSYDVIYCRDPVLLFLVGLRFGFSNLVYESHDAKYNFFVKKLLKKGVYMVVISEGIRDYYLSRQVPEERMVVAHDGVDEDFFKPHISQHEARKKLGLPQEAQIAMYIGGFDAWKGVDTFFQASKHTTKVQFVAIGGRVSEVEEYKTMYPKVMFLGPQPYEQLSFNQQAADVLVIPNTAKNKLSSQYTSPLKLFAHMTAKKPLVVSDIPSIRVLLEGYAAVTFFSPDNSTNLALKIEDTLCKPQNGPDLEKLYDTAKKYTWKDRAEKICDFVTKSNVTLT